MVSTVGSDPTNVCSNRARPANRNLIFLKISGIINIESEKRKYRRSYSCVRLRTRVRAYPQVRPNWTKVAPIDR